MNVWMSGPSADGRLRPWRPESELNPRSLLVNRSKEYANCILLKSVVGFDSRDTHKVNVFYESIESIL